MWKGEGDFLFRLQFGCILMVCVVVLSIVIVLAVVVIVIIIAIVLARHCALKEDAVSPVSLLHTKSKQTLLMICAWRPRARA